MEAAESFNNARSQAELRPGVTSRFFVAVLGFVSLTITLWLPKRFTSAPTAATRSRSGWGAALTAGSGARLWRRLGRARRSWASRRGDAAEEERGRQDVLAGRGEGDRGREPDGYRRRRAEQGFGGRGRAGLDGARRRGAGGREEHAALAGDGTSGRRVPDGL